jgi:purine-binding chemotaxis protein CheW
MEAVASQIQNRTAIAEATGPVSQYLTFTLGPEDYGVEILRVQEIRGWQTVTRVPSAPAHMLGVLNLRGVIVPIIDMRMRFRMPNVEYTPMTVIIVLTVQAANGTQVFGIVVDSVSDVLDVKATEVKAKPDFGAAVSTDFISGLATVGDRMVMLLDIDRLLSADELSALATAANA